MAIKRDFWHTKERTKKNESDDASQPKTTKDGRREQKHTLESFDTKKTGDIGLWWHPEYSSYSSQVFSLASLREFKGNVRVVMRKNKAYKQGSNRPNFIAVIADSKTVDAMAIGVEDIDDSDDDEIEVYTAEQVRAIINGAYSDCKYGFSDPYDTLPTDFCTPYTVKRCHLEERNDV